MDESHERVVTAGADALVVGAARSATGALTRRPSKKASFRKDEGQRADGLPQLSRDLACHPHNSQQRQSGLRLKPAVVNGIEIEKVTK